MVRVKEDMTGWVMAEHGVPDSRLVVIKQVEDYIRPNGQRSAQWLCECSCGENNRIIVRADQIKDGRVKSCGCLNLEQAKIHCSELGKLNHQLNEYTLYQDYGVGRTTNTNEEFYFDLSDYDKIKKICWIVCKNEYGYKRLVGTDCETGLKISMIELLGYKGYDHKDRNPLNNRRSNLRKATSSQQCMNRNKFENNTSGFIGVSWRKREEKWCSYIQINKKTISLGYYKDKKDAIIARLKAEKKYYGEFSPQRHLFKEYGINIEGDSI